MKKGISQEGLKLIACITMLIDHIGYRIIFPLYSCAGPGSLWENLYWLCRSIGRISFPIFCFLLVEGFDHTHDRKKYALRLALGAVLSVIPYSLFAAGQLFYVKQNVMVTLLLGFFMLAVMERCPTLSWKSAAVIPFLLLGALLKVDYGWAGMALIALFALSRYLYPQNFIRLGGMVVLFHLMSGKVFTIGSFSLPMQVLGVLSLLFIANYDGRKCSHSKALQWGFYLFYPAHLLLLTWLSTWIPVYAAL